MARLRCVTSMRLVYSIRKSFQPISWQIWLAASQLHRPLDDIDSPTFIFTSRVTLSPQCTLHIMYRSPLTPFSIPTDLHDDPIWPPNQCFWPGSTSTHLGLITMQVYIT